MLSNLLKVEYRNIVIIQIDNVIRVSKNSVFEHSDSCPTISQCNISTDVIRDLITNLYRINPNLTPDNIKRWALSEYGIELSYSKCWRALQSIKAGELQLSCDSYKKLESFFICLEEENPGTSTNMEIEADGTFRRSFVCFSASKNAVKYSLPVIVVDACHMRSKFGGMIMLASTKDCLGKIIPVAAAVVPTEDYENWRYFLDCLKSAIPALDSPETIFMSDRDKGISKAVSEIFSSAIPAKCVWHLERNVNARFKSKFEGRIWRAAKALTVETFHEAMEYISAANIEAYNYLMDADPSTWATCFFPRNRFGIVTSNSAESLNSMFESLRNGSALNFFSKYAEKVPAHLMIYF